MSDKKGKKGRKAASAGGDRDGDGEFKSSEKQKLDEVTIEVFQARVRDLTEKLERFRTKCEVLSAENEALGKAQTKSAHDKQDIVEFLNIKVTEHERQINSLEQRITQLDGEKAEMARNYQSDLDAALAEARGEIEGLQAVVATLRGQLSDLGGFATQKTDLETQLKSLRAQLDTKERSYKDTIHNIERKVLQDKNLLKREMLQKVNETVAHFQRVADQQMAETTKRAIRENTMITTQLQKMSVKTTELISENDTLKHKLARLRTNNALLVDSETALAKKNVTLQGVVKLLYERLKENDEVLELAYEGVKVTPDGRLVADTQQQQQQQQDLPTSRSQRDSDRFYESGATSNESLPESDSPAPAAPHHQTSSALIRQIMLSFNHFDEMAAYWEGLEMGARGGGGEEQFDGGEEGAAGEDHGSDGRSRADGEADAERASQLAAMGDMGRFIDRLHSSMLQVAHMVNQETSRSANSDAERDTGPPTPATLDPSPHPPTSMHPSSSPLLVPSQDEPHKAHTKTYLHPYSPPMKRRLGNLNAIIATLPTTEVEGAREEGRDTGRREIACQTAPLPFAPKVEAKYLLGEVRQWGAPAISLPQKGLGQYVARRYVSQPPALLLSREAPSQTGPPLRS